MSKSTNMGAVPDVEPSPTEKMAHRMATQSKRLSDELMRLRELRAASPPQPPSEVDRMALEGELDSIISTAALMRDELAGRGDTQVTTVMRRGSKPGSYLRAVRKALGYTYP